MEMPKYRLIDALQSCGRDDFNFVRVESCLIESAIAHLRQSPAPAAGGMTVPDGFVLMPRRATDEMVQAAEGVEDLYRRGTPNTWRSVYEAFVRVAAAPSAGNALPADEATTVPDGDRSNECAAVLPNGVAVTNVYEAYDAGLEEAAKVCAAVGYERMDLGHDQGRDAAFHCSNRVRGMKSPLDAAQPADSAAAPDRYERLRILGCAPYGSKQLEQGTVLRFQSLDAFTDADIAANPSRGEFKGDSAAVPAAMRIAQEALNKIADLRGAWGPFPEKNPLWQGMAIVTAREALAAIAARQPPAQADQAPAAMPEWAEWLETEVSAIDCRYRGDPSYDHDAYWMKDRVLKLVEEAKTIFATHPPAQADQAPAANVADWCADRTFCTKHNHSAQADHSAWACPHCGGTKGHWGGCKAPDVADHSAQAQAGEVALPEPVAVIVADKHYGRLELLKPAGQFMGRTNLATLDQCEAYGNARALAATQQAIQAVIDRATGDEIFVSNATEAISALAAGSGKPTGVPQDWREAIQGVIDELGSAPQNFQLVTRLTRLLRLAADASKAAPAGAGMQEQDAKDAARYRWLRDHDKLAVDFKGDFVFQIPMAQRDRVDAAIDAAIATREKSK